MPLSRLTPLLLDALREIGGIGAGHAATALSQLVDQPIDLEVPRIGVVDLADVPKMYGGPERLVCAAYSRMLGDISGGVLFMIGSEAALSLVDMMHGREPGGSVSIGHDEEALLRHVASILIAAYLAAIARMADLDVLPAGPAVGVDMAGALLEAAVAEIGLRAQQAVLVTTSFVAQSGAIDASLFFVPDPDSVPVLLGRLGMV